MSTRKIKTIETKKKSKIIFFRGRLNRRKYIIGLLLTIPISFIFEMPIFFIWAVIKLISTIFGFNFIDNGGIFGAFISLILVIISISIPSLVIASLNIRRHHDLNQSAYFYLIAIILISVLGGINQLLGTLIFLIYFCYLVFKTGTNGNNKYGDEDKEKGLKNILGIQK